MKTIKLKSFTFITLLLFIGFNSFAQISKVEIVATGLTCSMCSKSIYQQLKTISDVKDVETDLNTNTFLVTLIENSTVTPRLLKDKVEKAGFFVGSMIVTLPFKNLIVEDKLTTSTQGMKLTFISPKVKLINNQTRVKILNEGFVSKKEYRKIVKELPKEDTTINHNKDRYFISVI